MRSMRSLKSTDRKLKCWHLDAMVAGGAIAAVAFERADPPGLAAHRIERIEACELDVEHAKAKVGFGAPHDAGGAVALWFLQD